MKNLLIGLLALGSISAFASNEAKNLTILLKSGDAKVSTALAAALATNSESISINTKCEKKDLLEFEKNEGVRFEDCTTIINEKIDEVFEKGVVISFHVRSTLINGKASNPVLNKSLLRITKF